MSDLSVRTDVENSRFFEDVRAYMLGDFRIKEKSVKEEVVVSCMNMVATSRDPLRMAGESDFRGLSITLTLGGGCAFENDLMNCVAAGDSTNVIYTQGARFNLEFSKGHYECFSLRIGEAFLDEAFLNQLPLDSAPTLLLRNDRTSLVTRICVGDLLASQYEGVLADMFVQGKILEIMASEFSHILSPVTVSPPGEALPLSRRDVNALKKAREILMEFIADPPSIPTLARMVGINQFKLKKGFKQVFNTTPYAVVRDHRMAVAQELLKSSELNVAEVSRRVGIKNQAHFTRVFFRRYGVLPRDVMKTRTYFDFAGRPVERGKRPLL